MLGLWGRFSGKCFGGALESCRPRLIRHSRLNLLQLILTASEKFSHFLVCCRRKVPKELPDSAKPLWLNRADRLVRQPAELVAALRPTDRFRGHARRYVMLAHPFARCLHRTTAH